MTSWVGLISIIIILPVLGIKKKIGRSTQLVTAVTGLNLILLHWVIAGAHRLSYPVVCGIFVPWSGIKPESPELEGGFLATGPPGKSADLSLADS